MAQVLRRGSRTAIELLRLTEQIAIIELHDGPLVIRNAALEDVLAEDWAVFDYPVAKAAEKFLNHAAGVSHDARRALEALLAPTSTNQETPVMSIEATLTRIADSLERLADTNAGANLVLEQIRDGLANLPAAAAAAPKKTRGRPRKTGEEDPAPAPAAADPAPAAAAKTGRPLAEVQGRPLAEIQPWAMSLAVGENKPKVLAAVRQHGFANVSDWDKAGRLIELEGLLAAIEAETASNEAFQ